MSVKRLVLAVAVIAAVGLGAKAAYALKYPHVASKGVSCSYCHARSVIRQLTSFNMLCISGSGCHRPNSSSDAKKKALTIKDASNRFGKLPFQTTTARNYSHGWKIPNVNYSAGVVAQNNLGQAGSIYTKKIYCTRCHRVMGTETKYFLRKSERGNYICFACHQARRIGPATDTDVRRPLPATITVDGLTVEPQYSHPVEVSYSSARGAKPDYFYAFPRITAGYAETARPRLYTTYDKTKKDAVVCQSCHGPIHSSDSNPYTFDNLTTYVNTGNYSSSAGNLLRMYPITKKDFLCRACHKVQTHKGFMCSRCHTPHKRRGEKNFYLIQQIITTPSSGRRAVVFTSRSEMAARYQAGYTSASLSRTARQASNRICQVCHMNTKFHRNYSSPSGNVDRSHNYLGNLKYKFCPDCHGHTTGFIPSGCGTCHKFPPEDVVGGINSFKHAKHTNGNVEGTPSNTFWKTGRMTDDRSDTSYGFSCGRCHSPWAPYTAPRGSGYEGNNHYGSNVISQKVYTADVGFKIKTTVNSRPWNPRGTYAYSADGGLDTGSGNGLWIGAGTSSTCRNLYCHGDFYNGYTGNNPDARGNPAQTCGKCHGAKAGDPPGKMVSTGTNYGAHPRHVGNANSQQYGSGSPNFRCNACHNTTVFDNDTAIDSRKYHVNGIVNIKFDDGTQGSGFAVGDSGSNYNGYNDYTGRKPAMSVRPAYKTCRLIYCHSMGNRTQGNYSAPNNAGFSPPWPNWSSSSTGSFTTIRNIGGYTMKTRCARCHGNAVYKGITAAMPNYTSNDPSYAIRGPKENSHRKHVVENGFRCNVCHSATISQDNKSIVSTKNHVNRFYNISIIATYRDNYIGNNYDSAAKTCSNIRCHAGKPTPKWGNKIRCQNCHLNTTEEADKRIFVNSKFQSFSEAAAKIYSAKWGEVGHGSKGRDCTNCHKASVRHGTSSNPFRLYTLHWNQGGNPNALCEDCHGVSPGNANAGTKTGIQTHASSVTGEPGKTSHNFAMKCVDCHDPHGDNNKYMVHSTVARPYISNRRAESSNSYGQILTNATGYNIDFTNDVYTSDYARKFRAPKICQNCHRRTKDPSAPYGGRFRWYSAGDKTHGGAKCTNCHQHSKGFRGAGCDGCHGWPPTGTFNLISLATGAKNKRASGSTTAGVHFKHFTTFINTLNQPGDTQALTRSTVCGFCHRGGMYPNGAESGDIELGFNAFNRYTTGKYKGQTKVATGYYGYSGVGADPADDSLRCSNVKCHGAGGSWLTKSFGTPTAPKWDDPDTARCGKCHGAKKAPGVGSWPTSNAHARHAGADGSGSRQYDFMCRLCHSATVLQSNTTLVKGTHVNGQANFQFYTGTYTKNRVWSQSNYTGGDTVVNSGFGFCVNTYCHSRGTKASPPYANRTALPNYTAIWSANVSAKTNNRPCSFCHGNKIYYGITAAMPNYTSNAYGGPKENSHRKHVIENGLVCRACHSRTVNASGGIIFTNNTTRHVNKVYDIAILSAYSGTYDGANKFCTNVKCHGRRATPKWGNKIICQNCHMAGTAGALNAEDDFAWRNFSGTAAKIYSTEWATRGHGRPRSGSDYAFSNNSGAGKTCTNCHKPAVKHGTSNNYFRLLTSNPDRLCLACHGIGSERIPSIGFSLVTGIQTHSWYNISTAGYVSAANGGNKRKATLNGGWNFGQHDGGDQKKVKCVDCHDPHGDKNNYMIHTYPNFSGSDRVGRPTYNANAMQMTFSTVGGPQMNWSSYVKPLSNLGICQRCHSTMSNSTAMTNFNKGLYSDHNKTNRCTKCHKHRQGFKPSGCDGCHGYPPPDGPNAPNDWAEEEATPSSVGLHTPHAKNPRNRPGITAENDVAGGAGFKCNKCHADTADGADTNMGSASNTNAIMTQLTSVYGKWSPYTAGYKKVTDDTCRSIRCHTPRYYERTWKKPTGCDSCHGYRNKANGEAFNIQTTGSHKIHVSYSTPNIPGTDRKKYGLRCSNCHYNWQPPINNYSTHYSSYVNITANGPVNTKGGQFYGRGREFKGFTTGGELNNDTNVTCTKVYCHGNFTNGTTTNVPKWRKGAMTTTCLSCHKGRLTFNNGSTMPERHQKHVKTNQYGFACVRCHMRTTNNITTVIFNYSSHVNGRKDVYFNSDLNNNVGSFNSSSRQCSNIYCHSKGYRSSGSAFDTRTTLANYTADWDITASARTGGRPCSFCHGNKIYNGITAAMPNQTSLWGNSHRTHAIRNNFRCQICHSATVSANGAINYAGGKHVNGFKNITIIATYKQGVTNYGAGKTCDNVRCHAGKTTPQWGTYARCQSCHLSTQGDNDKRISTKNAGFQNFSETAPRIYSAQWGSVGHGSKGRDCTNCHRSSVAHGTTSNPFRLYTLNWAQGGNPNALCADCHGMSPGNSAKGVKVGIQTHASSITQTGRHNFAMKCVDCHDPHGDGNIFMLHSTLPRYVPGAGKKQVSNDLGQVLSNITVANVDFAYNNTTGGYASKKKEPKVCQVCHRRTYDPNNSPYPGRFRWYSAGDKAHGVAKCTNCHSHAQGFKGAKCFDCHGYPPVRYASDAKFYLLSGLGTNIHKRSSGSATAGAHGRHTSILLSGAADINTLCGYCHSEGMGQTGSDDGRITLKFNAFGYYTTGAARYRGQVAVATGYYGYSGAGASKGTGAGKNDGTLRCETVKCHGAKGAWLTKSFGNPTTPVWSDTTRSTVFCGSCHGTKKAQGAGTWPTTNAHARHAGTGTNSSSRQYDFMCRLCHNETVLGTATTLNKTKHVNGQANILLYTSEGRKRVGSGAYNGGDTVVNSGFGRCENVYCHSRGTDTASPYEAAGSYANYTAIWSADVSTRTNNRPCSFCHGNKVYNGITAAMPNYTSIDYSGPKENSHRKHVIENGFLCNICHGLTVSADHRSIIFNGDTTAHINRIYNVKILKTYSGVYNGVSKTCSGVKCHATKTTPQWGKKITCQNCHLSTASDVDKRILENSKFQSFSETAPRIYSTDWGVRGHGSKGRNCTNCHKSAVRHGTATNPFRLYTLNTGSPAGNPNALCEDCHGVNPGNPAKGTKTGIMAHASSSTKTGRHNFAMKCVDCHDPHGDNNLMFMFHSTVGKPRGTTPGNRYASSNQYGQLFANTSTKNVDFVNDQYSSDYARKFQAPKVCQVCHRRTYDPEAGSPYQNKGRFRWYSAGDKGHGTAKCPTCHTHGSGFKGARCMDCHGFPPRNVNTLLGRPGTLQADPLTGSTTAGAHFKHITTFVNTGSPKYETRDVCKFCHKSGMWNDGIKSSDIDLEFDAFGYYTTGAAKYRGQSRVATGYYGYSGKAASIGTGAGNNDDALRCENVKCHGAMGNWLTKSFGTPTAPKWDDPNTARCGKCHGAKKAPTGAGSWPTSKAHAIHAGMDTTKQQNLMCRNCHGITVLGTATTLDRNKHVNGEVYVKFTSEGRVDGRSSYSGDYTVNSGFGKCTNLYCHSKGTDRVAPYSNATAFANFTATWEDTRGSYKNGQGNKAKCNYCHGNRSWSGVTSAMPNYDDGTPKANKHPKHVRGYNFLCANCHVNVVANNTAIQGGNYTLHVNRTYNVNFGNQNTNPRGIDNSQGRYTSTNRGCRGTYCHSRGTKLNGSSAIYTNTTALANYTAHWGDNRGGYKTGKGNMAKCNYCHGSRAYSGMTSAMPNYNNGTPKANRHPMHVVTYGFPCTVCHEYVTSNNTSIDASGGSDRHVSKSYNIDFNKNVPGRFTNNTGSYTNIGSLGGGAGSKCKNTYCHSRGTDLTAPFNTRTSFANWTARWGDTRGNGGYKQGAGNKAKCNYCHGNRAYSGITAAMPNYSGTTTDGVTVKRNSHRKHVIVNGIVCSTCHYGVIPNNTSISDRTRHVNQFYNISIAPDKAGGSGTYTYYSDGGTCSDNNTCHGSSAPKWGDPTTADCKKCHLTSSENDLDDYGVPNNGIKAKIYSTEWGQRGHGKMGRTCENCHNSNVEHNFAQNPLRNPFRLFTSDPDRLCLACHGNTTERADPWGLQDANNYRDIVTHSQSATNGDAAWNTHQYQIIKCVDCHDPHGDKNSKMIHKYINFSGSDRFGRPAVPTSWNGVNKYNETIMMTFTAWGGQLQWSSFANNNRNNSICRRCHTPKGGGAGQDPKMGNNPDPNFGEMTKGNYAKDHQEHSATCTAACHTHKSGFKGGGESSGGMQCKGCHSPLFNAMTTGTGYHHVLANTSTQYRNITLFTGGAARDPNRRCLMCHVDHNVFRPDLNNDGTGGRARNLRFSAGRLNDRTGINTDFWPAKRTGKYAGTNPVSGPAGYFGVCVSCHRRAQSKNTTFQLNQQGERATPVFNKNFIAIYTSSSHNFQIITGMSRFMSDGSKFRANCSKCHGSPPYAIQNPQNKGQTGAREQFGLHDSKYKAINRTLGGITTYTNPLSKQLCYRCHGRGGANQRGSYDYYSSVEMGTSAKLIQSAIEAKSYGHPVGKFAGHEADEFFRLSQGWWGNDGANKHIECTDCHNTHGGNASIKRVPGSPDGNKVSGAQAGVWGIQVKVWPSAGGDPSYAKMTTIQYQYQLCGKCHSKFSWNTNTPPEYPSPGFGTWTGSKRMTDVLKEFNPNNYGYHPVVARGKNRPLKTANPNWPVAKSNVRWYDSFNNVSGLANMSGLDWAFVPPFNRRSLLACSDCHQTDATGRGVSVGKYASTITPNGWGNTGNLGDLDANYATSPANGAKLKIDLAGAAPYTGGNPMNLTVTALHGGSSSKLLNYQVWKDTTSVKTGIITFAKGASQTKPVLITSEMQTNSCDNATCVNGNVSVELWDDGATVFSVDSVSIDGEFTMNDAIRGPHGSMMQWILASANTNIYVDWDKNGDYNGTAPREQVNDPAEINTDQEKRIFCFNCHRSDVYKLQPEADDATNVYSRFKHWKHANISANHAQDWESTAIPNKWGIPCMFCHGGGKAGAIHGDWQGATWAGSAISFARPVSVRLLNGAGAFYNTVINSASANGNLMCYIGPTSNEGNGLGVGGCGANGMPEGSAQVGTTVFNYTYTDYTNP